LRARAFPGKKGFKHLMAVPGGSSWSLVNEVEHLTAGRIFAGLPAPESAVPGFSPPWEGSDGTIWSRSAAFGFLASDPRRIGPGFSVESIVHLPGLALSRRLANARNYLAAAGVGFLAASAPSAHAAAPGAAEAGLFRLAFGGGWGKSAREVYTAFLNAIRPVLRLEMEARARCLDKHRKRLEERAHRSLEGLAANTPLTYAELLAAASIVRLAAETGTMDPRLPGRLEGLRIKAASGHLAVTSGRELSKEEEDFSRANVVRLSLMMDSGEIS
jgi:protein arginine kinase